MTHGTSLYSHLANGQTVGIRLERLCKVSTFLVCKGFFQKHREGTVLVGDQGGEQWIIDAVLSFQGLTLFE